MTRNFFTALSACLLLTFFIGLNETKADSQNEFNSISLEDLESLAEETSEEQEVDYYLHHYNCQVYLRTEMEVNIIKKIFHPKAKLGMTVDLSCLTQYFNKISTDGEGPCTKGDQKTCNQLVLELLGRTN